MSSSGERENLRRRAEQRLPAGGEALQESLNAEALVHELRVHQVELEIQNEELRRAQQELESSRDGYLYLYNRAPVGYLTLDKNGIVRRHNETLLEMIDHASGDVRDRPFDLLLSEESRKQFLARFRSFFSQPEGKNLEVQILTGASGEDSLRDVRLTGRTTRCDSVGEDPCLLLVMTDITQQKRSERRIQGLLSEKELLMQEVHHRVKNNLSTVMSILNLQKAGTTEAGALDGIDAASNRIGTIYAIYELLQSAEDYREVDLRDYINVLLTTIAEGLERDARSTITRRLASVRVTTRQAVSLGIILNELVADAYKHAFPAGSEGAHVDEGESIEVVIEIGKGGSLVLSVQDNGVGMGSGGIKDTKGGEGSSPYGAGGLGLTLVRSQVAQLGGTFAVEDANPGTRFTCTLPLPEQSRAH